MNERRVVFRLCVRFLPSGYSGPHFSDRRVSYTRRSRRWSDGEASASHGGVQGPGRPGGDPGGQDGQRGGRPVRRPPDPDPRLEEEAPGRGGGGVRGRGEGGPGGRRPAGRVVRADRAAQDGTGVGEKKAAVFL